MKRYDARSIDLMEGWSDYGLAFHLRGHLAAHGPGDHHSPLRFLQIEEGERLAGEVAGQQALLLVLDGIAWVEAAGEREALDRGSVALIPPYVPYTVGNVGPRPAHLLCMLPDAAIESVFVAPLQPLRIEVRAPAAGASLAS